MVVTRSRYFESHIVYVLHRLELDYAVKLARNCGDNVGLLSNK